MVCHAVFVQNHGGEKQVVPYAICLWDVIYLFFIKGVETIDFLLVCSQPRPRHLHHVQHWAQPHLPCLCWKGGGFQVNFILSLYLVFLLRYELTDFYATPGPTGFGLKGPIWSPFRAFYNLTIWSMFIVVPICYRAIFKFRKVQDLKTGNDWIELCQQRRMEVISRLK